MRFGPTHALRAHPALIELPKTIPWTLVVSIFFYAASFVKFYVRDPLSTQTGPQGPIEFLLLAIATAVILLSLRGRHWTLEFAPTVRAFAMFGFIVVGSSVFSYDPLLSCVKGIGFLLTCAIATIAASAYGVQNVVRSLYYSVFAILCVGLLLKLASGESLFTVEQFSGRMRFGMFAWHSSVLADLCALIVLASLTLTKRPPLWCQVFLVALNLVAGSRTSSAMLLVALCIYGVSSFRVPSRISGILSIGFGICALATALTLVAVWQQSPLVDHVESMGQGFYGDKFEREVASLNGRTDVWDVSQQLILHSLILGYGMDGARDVLINNTSWDAGNAHNCLMDIALAGGIPATIIFLVGWCGAVIRAWRYPGKQRVGILALQVYIAGFGIVSPNLTYSQALAPFLIIILDILVSQNRTGVHADLPVQCFEPSA